jgi:hypothetical protein
VVKSNGKVPREYLVTYAHKMGFGNIHITVYGKLIIDEIPMEVMKIYDKTLKKYDQTEKDIVVMSFIELDPAKEVYSE